ncbi:MAG: glycosyltransferase family 1 protein [Deltaproteobacteria bacterium]|nr:glycosyltransferase family 1 protein [Deltaproteobacteria bacterium]
MKWRIKNPAPIGEAGESWGDTHFSRALAGWLTKLGQQVEIDFFDQWDNQPAADATLVLRGRQPYRAQLSGIRVLWIISHPDDISLDECSQYDLVFAASTKHAVWLQARLDCPVAALLQGVDCDRFKPGELSDDSPRTDFVFVGNTRNVERESVLWAVRAGLPLKIWGRGWQKWVDPKLVVADYLPNQQLAGLYSTAKVTFNDHWPDMRKHGYVNNRVFEALACGLPVISDYQPAMGDLFGEAVMQYRTKKQFDDCIEQLLLEYPDVTDRVQAAMQKVRKQHSFEVRARKLIEVVSRHKRG